MLKAKVGYSLKEDAHEVGLDIAQKATKDFKKQYKIY